VRPEPRDLSAHESEAAGWLRVVSMSMSAVVAKQGSRIAGDALSTMVAPTYLMAGPMEPDAVLDDSVLGGLPARGHDYVWSLAAKAT